MAEKSVGPSANEIKGDAGLGRVRWFHGRSHLGLPATTTPLESGLTPRFSLDVDTSCLNLFKSEQHWRSGRVNGTRKNFPPRVRKLLRDCQPCLVPRSTIMI